MKNLRDILGIFFFMNLRTFNIGKFLEFQYMPNKKTKIGIFWEFGNIYIRKSLNVLREYIPKNFKNFLNLGIIKEIFMNLGIFGILIFTEIWEKKLTHSKNLATF